MNSEELVNKLSKYPELKNHIEELLRIAENKGAGLALADDAEERVIEVIREVGHEVMQTWAQERATQASSQLKTQVASAKKYIKKK